MFFVKMTKPGRGENPDFIIVILLNFLDFNEINYCFF